ncbi:PREDICTED: cold and drought-regulated protein CORA-like [Priapulus caudatus]|uniref:Cold and drought-regulated protein CORA-like n=1 Tax=Priapulus caudatus TaxID=37621 RepID=A0ABM1E7N2_PRICU|nr:PREDICTED: cold and drought-regulated protein CORA-like [Priapulus caudatus]
MRQSYVDMKLIYCLVVVVAAVVTARDNHHDGYHRKLPFSHGEQKYIGGLYGHLDHGTDYNVQYSGYGHGSNKLDLGLVFGYEGREVIWPPQSERKGHGGGGNGGHGGYGHQQPAVFPYNVKEYGRKGTYRSNYQNGDDGYRFARTHQRFGKGDPYHHTDHYGNSIQTDKDYNKRISYDFVATPYGQYLTGKHSNRGR